MEPTPDKAIYAILDKQIGEFHEPMTLPSDIVAKRSFAIVTQDSRLHVKYFPTEFDLFKIGEYDHKTGQLKACPTPVFIMNGAEAVRMLQTSK